MTDLDAAKALTVNKLSAGDSIVLGAAGGKVDFTLKANITSIEANKTEVQLSFTGDFNPMMAMMIKGPISKSIETLATNLPNSIQ